MNHEEQQTCWQIPPYLYLENRCLKKHLEGQKLLMYHWTLCFALCILFLLFDWPTVDQSIGAVKLLADVLNGELNLILCCIILLFFVSKGKAIVKCHHQKYAFFQYTIAVYTNEWEIEIIFCRASSFHISFIYLLLNAQRN